MARDDVTTPREALDSMYLLGRHPACRAGHAKGVFCAGRFEPYGEAAELTEAAHLHETPSDVTVRLSRQVADPDTHDGKNGRCGMATRFHLPDRSYTDLIAISLDRFTNQGPDDFVAMNRALFDPRDGAVKKGLKRLWFVLNHRDLLGPLKEAERKQPVPSYANCRFNSLNTFVWTKHERECLVRYSWIPEEGERSLAKAEALALPSDYLQQDVVQRLGSKPSRPLGFRLEVQVAAAEDHETGRVVDPVQIWPAPARVVTAGRLELTRLVDSSVTGDGFNPLNLTRGIRASDDKILNFRHALYDLAAAERVAGNYQ